MKKIILLDGNGLIFRAFYATSMRMSMAENGTPTNAIYLFSSIVLKLIVLRYSVLKLECPMLKLGCSVLKLLIQFCI